VWQLATAIAEIALRRRGPESLPDSTFLVGLLLVAFAVSVVVDTALLGNLSAFVFGDLVAQLALVLVYVYAVLAFFRLERRYRQTVSAIFGINVFVYVLLLPVSLGGLILGVDPVGPSLVWFRIILVAWLIIAEASIFARALSQPLILGFMFEILYLIPSLVISQYFSPATD
jgi:hypothetical protein